VGKRRRRCRTSRSRVSHQEVLSLQREFPVGALVTVQWVSSIAGYDPEDMGYELAAPERAVILEHIPGEAFMSHGGPPVIPFLCLHGGALRASTTYACEIVQDA